MQEWIDEYKQTESVEIQKRFENQTPIFDYGMWEDIKDTAAMDMKEILTTDAIFSEKVNEEQYHLQNKNTLKAKGLESEYLKDYKVFENLKKEKRSKYDNAIKSNDLSFLKDFKNRHEAEKEMNEFNSYKKINDFINSNTDLKMNNYESIENNVKRDVTNLRTAISERKKSGDSIVGSLIGGVGGVIADPLNTATLFIPVGGAYKAGYSLISNIVRSAAKVAAFESSVEALNQYTHIYPYRRDYLGDNYTVIDSLKSIGYAALGGAVASSIFDGVGHFMSKKEIDNINKLKQDHEALRDKETMTADEVDAIHAIDEAVAATNGLNTVKTSINEKELIDKNAENWVKARLQAANGEEINIPNNELALQSFKEILNDVDNVDFKNEIGEDLYNFIKENETVLFKDGKTYDQVLKDIDNIYTNHNVIKDNLTKKQMVTFDNTMKMAEHFLQHKNAGKRINNKDNKLFVTLRNHIQKNGYNLSKQELRIKANEILAEQVLVDKLAKQDIAPQPRNMASMSVETKKINTELKKNGITTDKDIASVKVMDEAFEEQAIIDNQAKIGDNIEDGQNLKEKQELKEILEHSGLGEDYKKLLEDEKALESLLACGI